LNIRRIQKSEIPGINALRPEDWHFDLEQLFSQHHNQDYFYSVVAEVSREIVGTGIALIHSNVAWLGTIIVRKDFRNQGIGTHITRHLVDYSLGKGIESILLTASDMGLPIYEKMGFRQDIGYVFLKTDHPIQFNSTNNCIMPITETDHQRIFDLDQNATGERRSKFLLRFLPTGFKFEDTRIHGYYLPEMGNGLVVADSEEAGQALLQFKLARGASFVCLPDNNLKAIGWLVNLGYYPYLRSPRMYMHKNVVWNPGCIYSRAAGYMG
jgi:GNAT superfamily N-acetyltransferase